MSKIPYYRTITTTTGDTIHIVEIQGENARPHSINGPAWKYANGHEEYYIYGLKYQSQSSWEKTVANYKKSKRVSKED